MARDCHFCPGRDTSLNKKNAKLYGGLLALVLYHVSASPDRTHFKNGQEACCLATNSVEYGRREEN